MTIYLVKLLTIRWDTSSSELVLKLPVLLDVLFFSRERPAQFHRLCQAVAVFLSRWLQLVSWMCSVDIGVALLEQTVVRFVSTLDRSLINS